MRRDDAARERRRVREALDDDGHGTRWLLVVVVKGDIPMMQHASRSIADNLFTLHYIA